MPKPVLQSNIIFYVLPIDKLAQGVPIVCKIVTKAYSQNCKIFLHVDNQELLHSIDTSLWTLQEKSFIPHMPITGENWQDCPILLGQQLPQDIKFDVYMNLTNEPVESYSGKIVEFVCQDNEHKQLGRAKFNFYKGRDDTITTHKI